MSLLKDADLTKSEMAVLAGAALLLAWSLPVYLSGANSTDKSWLLLVAGEWLSGKRLYVDLFEVNPPLIIWLYAAPVWLSRHIGFLSAYNALGLLCLAAIAFVIALCERLLARHPGFADSPKKRLFFCLLLAYAFIFFVVPSYFSDRDHLLLVLTFPYIMRFAPGLARCSLSFRLRVTIGLLAGIGFCLKPHALVIFAALQLLYILRERSPAVLWTLENKVVGVLACLYAAALCWLLPEYVHTVLPMALATYSAYSRKANGAYSIIAFIVIAGITFSDFRPGHASPFRRGVYYFLGVCLAYLAYGLLNNGWAYTYAPLLGMARILTGWVLLEFVWLRRDAASRGLPTRQFAFGVRSCGFNLLANAVFYCICFAAYMAPSDCEKNISCRSSALFFNQALRDPPPSFGVMAMEHYKWPELARRTGAPWQTRFNHLWMLPKFLLSDSAFTERHAWIIDYVGRAYAEDLNGHRPAFIYVDASPEIFRGHPNLDLPGYFSKVPAFKEAWSHYSRASVIDACIKAPAGASRGGDVTTDCRFDVYKRMPGS